jgi:hypothetical protein
MCNLNVPAKVIAIHRILPKAQSRLSLVQYERSFRDENHEEYTTMYHERHNPSYLMAPPLGTLLAGPSRNLLSHSRPPAKSHARLSVCPQGPRNMHDRGKRGRRIQNKAAHNLTPPPGGGAGEKEDRVSGVKAEPYLTLEEEKK